MQNKLSGRVFWGKLLRSSFHMPYQCEIYYRFLNNWFWTGRGKTDLWAYMFCCFLLSDKKFVTESFMSPNLPGAITEPTTGWWVTPQCPTPGTTDGTRLSGQSSILSWYLVSLDFFSSGPFCCWGEIYLFYKIKDSLIEKCRMYLPHDSELLTWIRKLFV